MVGGRRGGYRDHEVRDRESDIGKVARGREGYEFRVENGRDLDHGRGQARYVERQKDRDGRDRVKSRHRDVREREVVNGGRSFASRNGEGSGNGHSKKRAISVMDRELGELSSGSGGSDELSDSLATTNIKNVENGPCPVEEKKRKFSPIVWDIDEKQVGVKLKNKSTLREDSHALALPSAHAHLTLHQSTQVNLVEANLISSETSSHVILETVRSDVAVAAGTTDSPAASKSPLMVAGLASQDPEHGAEEDDYVPTRNISASRWADVGVSPGDEGEIIEDGVVNKSRKVISESVETLNAGRISPESGEFTRDGSQEALSRSSGSGRQGATSQSSSDDDCPGGELDRNDYMDVDGDGGEKNGMTESEDEKSNSSDDLAVPPQRSINMLDACRSVDEFEKLNKIDEGTYGVVFRARDTKNGEVVALKKVKMEKEKEGFPLTSLREINILLSFHHPSVVDVKEVVVGSKLDDIFMVMEYMEHDLKALMETMKQPFSQSEVKCLMLQLLEGVNYLHDNWVLHRDLKTSNLLLNNRGELKICDFGLARQYGSPLKPYTQLVVTLWYRAPELLLGAKEYSTAIDMWSIGCIMAEMLAKEPLFSGKNEIDQLSKIYKTLGTPNEKIWPGFASLPGVKVNFAKNPLFQLWVIPGQSLSFTRVAHYRLYWYFCFIFGNIHCLGFRYNKLREKFPPTSFSGRPSLSEAGFDLLNQLLTYDPKKRITAEAALNHGWFREVPLPKSKEFMPTFPAQHAQDRRLRRVMKSPDPLQELRDKERRGELIGTGSLFG